MEYNKEKHSVLTISHRCDDKYSLLSKPMNVEVPLELLL